MVSKWNYVPLTEEEKHIKKRLAETLSISPAICSLLVQRGVKTEEQVKKFFRPQLSDLYNPFLLKDMDKAVARLNQAMGAKEKILIYGDYDVDGTTAVALVYKFLNNFYSNIDYYIPDRYDEGYGISIKGIDYAADNGFTLVIALDCGIKAVEKVAYAKERGLGIDFNPTFFSHSMVKDGLFVVQNKRGDYEMYDVGDSKNAVSKGKYSQLGLFNGDVTFAVKSGKGIVVINKDFEEVKKLSDKITQTINYTEGLAAFCKNGKWGYLDEKGEEAISAKYDAVTIFQEGLAFVQKGDRIMLIDKKGETIKSFSSEKYELAGSLYNEGYCPMMKGDKVVFLDKKGEESSDFSNSKMERGYCYGVNDGKTIYTDGDEFGIVDKSGEIVLRAKYENLAYASPDRYIAEDSDGKWGVITAEGEEIIPFDYASIVQMSTDKSHYFAFEDSDWILIDEKGEQVGTEEFSDFNPRTDAIDQFYSEANQDEAEMDYSVDAPAYYEPANDSVAVEEPIYDYESDYDYEY